MLLNLTNRYYVNSWDHFKKGILCRSSWGPSFTNGDLETHSPLLGKDNVRSFVEKDGFLIGGKVKEINPLTGYIIASH